MHARPFTLAFLLALGLVSAACAVGGGSSDPGNAVDGLRIDVPSPGALLDTSSVRVAGQTDVLGVTEVRVNGLSVPVDGEGRFETTVEMADGPGRIVAALEDREAHVDVIVDTASPSVVIESPEPASFVEGDELRVRGRVSDASLASVEANGRPVEVREDGTFEVVVETTPGAHRVRVTATDRAGRTGDAYTSAILGRFAAPETTHEDALVLDLGPDALVSLGDGVSPFLASSRLEPMILAANPVSSGIWGQLDVLAESHGTPVVALTPRDGVLQVTVVIPDVRMPVDATINLAPDLSGVVTVTRAVAMGSARLDTRDGLPVVTVEGVDVTLEGLLIDISGLFGWADRNIVTRAAQGMLERKIAEMIQTELPVRLEAALAGLEQYREVTVGEGLATMRSSFGALSVSPAGIHAGLDMAVFSPAPDAELGERSRGTLVNEAAAPASSRPDGVFAALSTDLANAAAHTAWVSGTLSRRIDGLSLPDSGPVTVGVVSLLVPGIVAAAPADAPVSFFVDTMLPPVVEPSESGLVAVELADVRIAAMADVDGELVPLFTISVGVRASADVALVDDAVSLSIPELTIAADAIDAPAALPRGERLDALLTALVEPQLERLSGLDGFALPSLAGFRIESAAAELDAGYLTFAADLTY
jgi:hypothetical protein